MRARNMLLAVGAALSAAAAANAQVYSASGLPVPIASNNTFTSEIVVPDFFTITDLNVIFKADHTYRGDLDIALIRGNNYIVLATDIGTTADNFLVRFDQTAVEPITAYTTGTSGFYRPEGTTGDFTTQGFGLVQQQAVFSSLGLLASDAVSSLDFWNGTNANGTWTLLVSDDASGDDGMLNYWSLEFNGAMDPNAPAGQPTPPPEFPGNFTGTPNVLFAGVSVTGTTIWDPENPQPGLTRGAGEAGTTGRYGTFAWDLAGNEVAYRIEHGGGNIELSLTNLTADLDLILIDASGTVAGVLAVSQGFGGANAESILFEDAAPGTYYAVVDTFSQPGSTYTLTYIPAPGAAALLGLGGLVATRRRR
jgi:subtilisin-like proprotein convertase family protein